MMHRPIELSKYCFTRCVEITHQGRRLDSPLSTWIASIIKPSTWVLVNGVVRRDNVSV